MERGPELLLVQIPVGALWEDSSHRSQEYPVLGYISHSGLERGETLWLGLC